MEQPKTYNGYNNEGTLIASYTGADATERINPDEVKAKIENVIQVSAEQTKKICSALENARTDADNAIIVQGTNMDPYIQAAIAAVEKIGSNMESIINSGDLYATAVQVHDELQDKNNQEAYNKTSGTSGVVKTQEA